MELIRFYWLDDWLNDLFWPQFKLRLPQKRLRCQKDQAKVYRCLLFQRSWQAEVGWQEVLWARCIMGKIFQARRFEKNGWCNLKRDWEDLNGSSRSQIVKKSFLLRLIFFFVAIEQLINFFQFGYFVFIYIYIYNTIQTRILL